MSEDKNIYYVYVHRKLSDNSIFYVGKGCNGRYKDTNGRNLEWWSVVFKENGFQPSIYQCDLTEEEALCQETKLIQELDSDLLTNISLNKKSELFLNIKNLQHEDGCKGTVYEERKTTKILNGRKPAFSTLCREYVKLREKTSLLPEEEDEIYLIETMYSVIKEAYNKFGNAISAKIYGSKAELLKLFIEPDKVREQLNLKIDGRYSYKEIKTKLLNLPSNYTPNKPTAKWIENFYTVKKTKFLDKHNKRVNGYIILGVK